MQHRIPQAQAPFEIIWDELGVAHVYASSVADAYRGMGYAAGSERLWQIHLSCAFANGEAAALLGERFMHQDALQRACNVSGAATGLPESKGDWITDAYLEGLNAWIGALVEVPPEFVRAGVQPREFTRADVAARYRFTSWFQHKSWTEKLLIGRLMATHGIDYFKAHVLHFSNVDAGLIEELGVPLRNLSTRPLQLAYPDAGACGSNNWAVTGELSASGKPILATDPHQPHSIPNTFFYVHLHAGDWDVFGAAFPGVPYFMMGYTRDVAWGLTTGCVDCYDLYIEQIKNGEYRSAQGWRPLARSTETIAIKGATSREVEVVRTPHGPLLENLTQQLGLTDEQADASNAYATALHWALADVPTSAGALGQLPLANSAEEFGELLFENDVCPLVNNIICVDVQNNLRRFIATTQSVRSGATGTVPLAGWEAAYDFPLTTAAQLTVEVNPKQGYSYTANNDTMGETHSFYIHNFPAASARADRIEQFLSERKRFTVADFQAMQLDLTDLRATAYLPSLLEVLRTSEDADVQLAYRLLQDWDAQATVDSAAACVYYPFLDAFWPRKFMRDVLADEALGLLPTGAPGLNRFDIAHFLNSGSPWHAHREQMVAAINVTMRSVVRTVAQHLGGTKDAATRWRWGDLHKISFWHSLAKQPLWADMCLGPDEIGGSGTTLGMAMHMPLAEVTEKSQEAEDSAWIGCRVYHGPAYRLIVDLNDPDHAQFVIAGGNGGRADSPFIKNHYSAWLNGEFYRLSLVREELAVSDHWKIAP